MDYDHGPIIRTSAFSLQGVRLATRVQSALLVILWCETTSECRILLVPAATKNRKKDNSSQFTLLVICQMADTNCCVHASVSCVCNRNTTVQLILEKNNIKGVSNTIYNKFLVEILITSIASQKSMAKQLNIYYHISVTKQATQVTQNNKN